MKIQEIYIQSFGMLKDRSFRLSEGVNVLEGPNESGKSTLAAFLKYIFYGPGQKGSPDRTRYLTGTRSGGWLTCVTEEDGNLWRIERSTVIESDGTKESLRDTVQIIDTRTNRVLPEKNPGEYFFGVNESIFTNTAFVGQLSAVRPDGSSLSGAVENMLHTADENVDIKRATAKLDQARRELLPKNSAGGKIREKEEEVTRLEEALTNARAKADRRMETETALRNATAKRQEMEDKKNGLEALTSAAETIVTCRKLAAAEDTANKLKSYQNALDVLSAPPFSDLHQQLDALEATPAKTPTKPENTGELHIRDEEAAAALEEGEYLESKSRLFLAVSIVMAISGLVALAAGAIMAYFAFPQFLLPFGLMAICVIVGVVFYVMQGKTLHKLDEILDEWGVDTLDELDEVASSGNADTPAADVFPAGDGVWTAESIAKLNALAEICGVPHTANNPAETLAALRKKAEKAAADRDTVRAKVENLTGRLGALQESIAGLDKAAIVAQYKQLMNTPMGKAAMQLDSEALAKAQKERDFTIGTWRAQSKKEAELEATYQALCSGEGRSPDVLEGLLATAQEELSELQKQHAGYTLALEALRHAGESLRTTVIPTVTKRASTTMAEATGGKYRQVAMDSTFGLQYTSVNNNTASVDMLSKGTADLAYISLRLALTKTLFGDKGREIPPMIFDETFAAVDETRLCQALSAMGHTEQQCLLFSCRTEEARQGAELGYNVLQMRTYNS